MRTNKLFVIRTLSIIVLLGILIGSGINKFGFYKSELSNSVWSTWNNSKTISRYNGSKEEISFPNIPVIVVYKNKIVGDVNSMDPLKIDISNKNLGSFWFPLVKKSDYSFSATCKGIHEIKTDSVIGQFIVNGEVNVSGKYKFIGSYSTETATKMVTEKVLNEIYNEVSKNLK